MTTDGNEHVRLLLETELALEGDKVVVAKNGPAVLRKIKEKNPDLVILDIKMPDMHRLKVLEAIRKENKRWSEPLKLDKVG